MWSFVATLRHLVFAMDKWFTAPILGGEELHPVGLPNTGFADLGADPNLDEVLTCAHGKPRACASSSTP